MRKYLQFFFILCVIGLAFEITNAQKQSSLVQPKGTTKEVDLCQIISAPKTFLDKEYVIDAVYEAGFEQAGLDTRGCPVDNKDRYSVLYKKGSDFDAQSAPKALTNFNKLIKSDKMFRQIAGKYKVRIENYEKSNPNDVRYEFQIVILAVVAVAKAQPKSTK